MGDGFLLAKGTEILGINLLQPGKFPRVGFCIYCSSRNDLTDEHIYPSGMDGRVVLPKASCSSCSVITSKFERRLMRDYLWAVRLKANVGQRRRKSKPATFPVDFIYGEQTITKELSTSQHHGLILVPELPLPKRMPQRPSDSLEAVRSVAVFPFEKTESEITETIENYASTHNAGFKFGNMIPIELLIQFSAKVAHGLASALYGAGSFKPYLRDIIKGVALDETYEYVGSVRAQTFEERGQMEAIVYRDNSRNLILCKMNLLGPNSPTYLCIVGEI